MGHRTTNACSDLISEMLAQAARAIEAKWRLMTDPVWALADMALITTILQTPDANEWEERFKMTANNRFPFDSLRTVIEGLSEAKLPMSARLGDLAARLDTFADEKLSAQQLDRRR